MLQEPSRCICHWHKRYGKCAKGKLCNYMHASLPTQWQKNALRRKLHIPVPLPASVENNSDGPTSLRIPENCTLALKRFFGSFGMSDFVQDSVI